ncbi:nucleoid-associated protein YejK [Thalassotalea agarivorans]|uniref:Nucleoid-associated protein n=1 Tax=Thalassotalea agarivorans TaxID=349064 RepID=A0A1I0F1P8_THASX|nr:nucleoid-associated protein YejK [Thalassotalea agarivorans]SET51913.1 nucleoid-associated protein [Thalassotalea agarivorans]
MSIIISNIAIHYVQRNIESNEVELTFGPQDIDINSKIETFVDALHHIYNGKGAKAYGSFSLHPSESEHVPFKHLMQDYLDSNESFNEFSVKAANALSAEIAKYDIEEQGYLVLCHYEYMGGRFLLVCVLPQSEHYSVDGELNLSANKHLDTAKLQLAARIDLFDYESNQDSQKYISFIKGRAGRKVSDFFLEFLGCEEGLDAKSQTQTLVQAVEDFVSVNQLEAQEKQSARKELLDYCKEKKASAQEVNVKEVGEMLAQEGGKDFYEFVQEQSYPMEESFPHEQAVVNKVTKYSGYGAGISISFERSHFGEEVVYNAANDSLTIYKVPPNLKAQLQALLQESNESE